MKKNAVSIQIVPFRFAPKFALGFAIIALFLAIFFSACATQDIQSQSISTKLGFEDAMREVCWSVESQEQCFDILTSSCDAGNYRNCTILGNAYMSRLDLSKSEDFGAIKDKAVEFFKKACEGKNGSGCFALQMFEDNPINIIAACEYGDFVACGDIVAKQNATDSTDKIIYAPDVVRWAQERNVKLLQDECEKAELRLKREETKDKIKFREEEVKTYCDFAKTPQSDDAKALEQ